MAQDDKRFYRELKRQVKKAGNKARRKHFKDQLDEDPTDIDNDFDFGYNQSSALNGRDGKNRKKEK
jgi:hypothetical protein